ncbi:MAG: cytochrome c3 family protein [Pikeienuella sp.]
MRLSIITVKKRPDSDDVSRREALIEGGDLRVGRGSDVDVNLPDVNIAYHHATFSTTDEGLILSGVGGHSLVTDNGALEAVVMSPGVSCRVGPYKLTAEEPPEHADFAVAIDKLEEDDVAPKLRPQVIAGSLPSRRAMSWSLAVGILALFLIWPLATVLTANYPGADEIVVMDVDKKALEAAGAHASFSPMQAAWKSGPMSEVHAALGENCTACHRSGFEMTTNNACLSCHAEETQHVSASDHPSVDLANFRCGSCHKEHEGGERPVQTAQTLCIDCHIDPKAVSANADLASITGFEKDHPELSLSVVTGVARDAEGVLQPELARISANESSRTLENSGLIFPHDRHMKAEGIRDMSSATGGTVKMKCSNCHQANEDGKRMRAIEQERDCGGCHKLGFTSADGGKLNTLPHAKAKEIMATIREYFAAQAAEGGVAALGPEPSIRRRPGLQAISWDTQDPLALAAARAELELKVLFEGSSCRTCHETGTAEEPDAEGRPVWYAEPALIQTRWMPGADFSHKSHEKSQCTDCHSSAKSEKASDVNMPAIATCRECHGATGTGEKAPKVSATVECLACHEFHIDGNGPASPAHYSKLLELRASN